MAELSENLLDAIKIVAESILKTNLDGMITDKGIITDATQKDKDRYKVKIGKTEIIAHSGVKYNINDVVWVYGPEGDYSKGAYIVGKVEDIITEENGNKIYSSPFGNYIQISDNIITANSNYGFKVGIKSSEPQKVDIKDIQWQEGYTVLALKFKLKSNVQDYIDNTEENIAGSYGIRVLDTQENELFNFTQNNVLGNPYNIIYDSTQGLCFDLTQLPTDSNYKDGLVLELYENGDFTNIKYDDNDKIPNLYFKDIELSFGYNSNEIDADSLFLYNDKSLNYNNSDLTRTIKARRVKVVDSIGYKIDIDDEDGDQWLAEGETISWYQFDPTAGAADNYSGLYWRKLNVNNKAENITVNLDSNKTETKFKAIIFNSNGSLILRSKEIVFTNTVDGLENEEIYNIINGLQIYAEDGSRGNYYIYSSDGKIVDNNLSNQTKSLALQFGDRTALSNDLINIKEDGLESVIWYVPNNNSCFNFNIEDFKNSWLPEGTNKWEEENGVFVAKGNETNKYLKIENNIYSLSTNNTDYKTALKIEETETEIKYIYSNIQVLGYYKLFYRVKSGFSDYSYNNVIKVEALIKDENYFTTKQFNFGVNGINMTGSEVTLVVDIENEKKRLSNDTRELQLTATLYNENNEVIKLADVVYEWKLKNEISNLGFKNNSDTDKVFDFISENNAQTVWLNYNNNPLNIEEAIIVECTLKGYEDYDLTSYLPIAVAADDVAYLSGPTQVVYFMSEKPSYFKTPYKLFDWNGNELKDLTWGPKTDGINSPTITSNDTLQPLANYLEGMPDLVVIAIKDNVCIWRQPVLIMLNRYPYAAINKWDGKSLVIDEGETSSIMANTMVAGTKENDNTFTGVVIGEVGTLQPDNTKKVKNGVFGYSKGIESYALHENGKMFIGKPNKGRIYFDGDNSTIYSQAYEYGDQGLKLDIDDGSLEIKKEDYIEVSSNFAKNNWEKKDYRFYVKDYDYILQEKKDKFNPDFQYYISNQDDISIVDFSNIEKYNRYKIKQDNEDYLVFLDRTKNGINNTFKYAIPTQLKNLYPNLSSILVNEQEYYINDNFLVTPYYLTKYELKNLNELELNEFFTEVEDNQTINSNLIYYTKDEDGNYNISEKNDNKTTYYTLNNDLILDYTCSADNLKSSINDVTSLSSYDKLTDSVFISKTPVLNTNNSGGALYRLKSSTYLEGEYKNIYYLPYTLDSIFLAQNDNSSGFNTEEKETIGKITSYLEVYNKLKNNNSYIIVQNSQNGSSKLNIKNFYEDVQKYSYLFYLYYLQKENDLPNLKTITSEEFELDCNKDLKISQLLSTVNTDIYYNGSQKTIPIIYQGILYTRYQNKWKEAISLNIEDNIEYKYEFNIEYNYELNNEYIKKSPKTVPILYIQKNEKKVKIRFSFPFPWRTDSPTKIEIEQEFRKLVYNRNQHFSLSAIDKILINNSSISGIGPGAISPFQIFSLDYNPYVYAQEKYVLFSNSEVYNEYSNENRYYGLYTISWREATAEDSVLLLYEQITDEETGKTHYQKFYGSTVNDSTGDDGSTGDDKKTFYIIDDLKEYNPENTINFSQLYIRYLIPVLSEENKLIEPIKLNDDITIITEENEVKEQQQDKIKYIALGGSLKEDFGDEDFPDTIYNFGEIGIFGKKFSEVKEQAKKILKNQDDNLEYSLQTEDEIKKIKVNKFYNGFKYYYLDDNKEYSLIEINNQKDFDNAILSRGDLFIDLKPLKKAESGEKGLIYETEYKKFSSFDSLPEKIDIRNFYFLIDDIYYTNLLYLNNEKIINIETVVTAETYADKKYNYEKLEDNKYQKNNRNEGDSSIMYNYKELSGQDYYFELQNNNKNIRIKANKIELVYIITESEKRYEVSGYNIYNYYFDKIEYFPQNFYYFYNKMEEEMEFFKLTAENINNIKNQKFYIFGEIYKIFDLSIQDIKILPEDNNNYLIIGKQEIYQDSGQKKYKETGVVADGDFAIAINTAEIPEVQSITPNSLFFLKKYIYYPKDSFTYNDWINNFNSFYQPIVFKTIDSYNNEDLKHTLLGAKQAYIQTNKSGEELPILNDILENYDDKKIYINFNTERRTFDDKKSEEKEEYKGFYFIPNSYLSISITDENFVPDKYYIRDWNGKWLWTNYSDVQYNKYLEYYLNHEDYGTTRFFNIDARQNKFPISLGYQSNIANRNFKLDWYGNLYSSGGLLSGTFLNGKIDNSYINSSKIQNSEIINNNLKFNHDLNYTYYEQIIEFNNQYIDYYFLQNGQYHLITINSVEEFMINLKKYGVLYIIKEEKLNLQKGIYFYDEDNKLKLSLTNDGLSFFDKQEKMVNSIQQITVKENTRMKIDKYMGTDFNYYKKQGTEFVSVEIKNNTELHEKYLWKGIDIYISPKQDYEKLVITGKVSIETLDVFAPETSTETTKEETEQ